MKRLIALGLTATLAGTLLSGCGGTNSGSQTQSGESASTDKNVTLQVLWFSDGTEGDVMMELAHQYEEENPGVTIELIETPYDEVDNKLKNMLAAGSPPAIARVSSFAAYENQLVTLTDYAESGDAFRDNFYDSLMFEIDGKMVAAPMDVTANGMIYNKTAFDKAGVSVPTSPDEVWTWDEYTEAVKTVMEKGGVKYGLVYDRSPFRFTTMLYQFGGRMLNEDMTASAFNSAENIAAVQKFVDLHNEGVIPTSVWLGSEDPNNLFRTGQIATHIGGSWLLSNYRTEITDFEWGVTYLPKEVQRSTIPGGKYLCAFQGSGVEEEAVKFIEWISQPEQNAYYCEKNYFLSPVKGNEELNYDYGKEMFAIFADELANTSEVPGTEWGYQALTALVQNDMRDLLAETLNGKYTAEEYTAQMDQVINNALAELNA